MRRKQTESGRRLPRSLTRTFCGICLAAAVMTVPALADESEPAADHNPLDFIVDVSAGIDGMRRDFLSEPRTDLGEKEPGKDLFSIAGSFLKKGTSAAVRSAATGAEEQAYSSIRETRSSLSGNALVNMTMKTVCSLPRSILDGIYDYAISQTNAQLAQKGTVDGPVEVYTSVGDSVQSGLGLEEYNAQQRFVVANENIDGSAPDLAARAMGAKVYQFHVPGARSSELRYLLDDDYQGDWITNGQLYYLSDGELDRETLDQWKETYDTAIREADVVGLDVGFNDYWIPAYSALYDIADDGRLPWDDMSAWQRVRAMSPVGALADSLASVGRAYLLHPFSAWKYNLKLADAVTKFTVDYPLNLIAISDSIYETNPDATLLIFVGYNPMEDWDLVPAWDDNLVGDVVGVVFAGHDLAKLYVALTYPGKAVVVDVRNIDVFTDQTMLFIFEKMSIDDSGFNPHPTTLGSEQMATQILSAIGQDSPYAVRETP